MAISDTARLISSLELQDKFSGTAKAGEQALGGLESKSNFVTRGFGLMGQAGGAVGNAFGTLKGRIGQLMSGPLGMLGLGAGLFGIGKFFTDSVGQATDFGKEVGRLAAVTGLGTEATSKLAAAFHHFGIETDDALNIAGLAEKNLFKLGNTAALAQKFQEKYGLSLLDSGGKLKDFNTLLLDTADFFNDKSIPSEQKAAAIAAIFGKSWQTLVPILGAGRKAISDAEEEAAALGLTLTKENLGALSKLKTATRDWGTALGGLKLQIGLAVVPLLTGLTTGATNFLKSTDEFGRTGSQRIVGFFKDVITFGEKAFGIIQDKVVPLVKSVIDGWNNLPEPLKGLLVKGVAGNFAIKFLLGFDPIAIAGAAAGKVAGVVAGGVVKSIGGFFGDLLGKTAAQKLVPQVITGLAAGVVPVFVTNQGFGLPTGVIPIGEAAAAGGVGALGGVLGTALAIGIPAGVIGLAIARQLSGDPNVVGSRLGFKPGETFEDLQRSLGLNTGAIANNTRALDLAREKGARGLFPFDTLPDVPREKAARGLFPFSTQDDVARERQARGLQVLADTALAPLGSIEKDVAVLPSIEESQKAILTRLGVTLNTKDDVARERAARIAAAAERTANKNFSPTVNVIPRVNVTVNTSTQVSVSNVVRTLNSYTAAIGSGPGGALDPSLL